MQIDHVQLSGLPGCDEAMRSFWGHLGFSEIPEPAPLVTRGGAWFRSQTAEIHIGIGADFSPARKAHPGLEVAEIDH